MFNLEQITTSDGYIHQGIVSLPKGARKGIIWVHGLTSTFYSNVSMIQSLSHEALNQQMAFASFNTRGHDMITGVNIVDPTSSKGYKHGIAGAGYEQFTECVYDIAAVIDFLRAQGITEVVLIGHSTGANKVCYYQAENQDTRVKGVVLGSPLSDRYGHESDKETVAMMKLLVESGKGDGLVLGKMFFPLTPKRYLSLMTPGAEDQFGYGETPPQLPYVEKLTVPSLVLLGSQDEYLDRPAEAVLEVFSSLNKYMQTELIQGALHSYTGQEKEVANKIVSWVASL